MTITLDLQKKLTLSLEKKGVMNIPVLAAKVAIDKSGSMYEEYRDGLVSDALDKFIVFAMKFDDNAELDVGFFNDSIDHAPPAYEKDVNGGYLKRYPVRPTSGTNYAPIIKEFVLSDSNPVAEKKSGFFSNIFGKKSDVIQQPATKNRSYLAVITDGDNYDDSAFRAALEKTNPDTFIQFIAIGTEVSLNYLPKIAKNYEYVDFINIRDPKNTSDQEFYDLLVTDKFVKWM